MYVNTHKYLRIYFEIKSNILNVVIWGLNLGSWDSD